MIAKWCFGMFLFLQKVLCCATATLAVLSKSPPNSPPKSINATKKNNLWAKVFDTIFFKMQNGNQQSNDGVRKDKKIDETTLRSGCREFMTSNHKDKRESRCWGGSRSGGHGDGDVEDSTKHPIGRAALAVLGNQILQQLFA